MATARPMVEARGIVNRFGAQVVHDHLDMQVLENEVFGVVDGSGTGKSVLLRTILGLQRPLAGSIRLEGRDISQLSEQQLRDGNAAVAVVMNRAIFVRATGTPTLRAAGALPPTAKIQFPGRVRRRTQVATAVMPSHHRIDTRKSAPPTSTVEASTARAEP